MLRRVDLRGKNLTKDQYQRELPRATLDVAAAMVAIEPILNRVKNGTEADLIALGEQFDGVRPPSIRVPQAALDTALAQLDPEIRAALELSAERIRKVHQAQKRDEKKVTVVDGGVVSEKWIPVDRVGLCSRRSRRLSKFSLDECNPCANRRSSKYCRGIATSNR